MGFLRVLGGMLVGRYLRRRRFGRSGINVGRGERWTSSLLGLALTWLSMRGRPGRGRLARYLPMLLGGVLAKRGLTGRCNLYRSMRVTSA